MRKDVPTLERLNLQHCEGGIMVLRFEVVVETKVVSKDGRVISVRRFKSRSFVSNFLKFLFEIYRAGQTTTKTTSVGTAYLSPSVDTLTDVNGVARNILTGFDLSGDVTPSYSVCSVDAPETDDSYGIVVGTGTTAVTMNDVNLESKILHGTTSGRLYYGKTDVKNWSVSDTEAKFDVTRLFTNYASDINVSEIGIIAKINLANAEDSRFLIVRDVISPADTVPTNYNYIVTYTFKIVV